MATPDTRRAKGGQRDYIQRDFPLEDINIVSRAKGGDGRTVEAYAAVFDTPVEIRDQYGHYTERIHRSAFNMSVNSGAAKRAICTYNHGYNPVSGKPDIIGSVPLGTPMDIRVESRGLLTVTRYGHSPLAEHVLEAIKEGSINAQSFEGPAFRSDPTRVPRAQAGSPLPNVTRLELGLRNYGPTPTPAYNVPMVTVVRSVLENMDEEERQELLRLVATTLQGTGESEPDTSTDDLSAGAVEPLQHSGRQNMKVRAAANRMAIDMALLKMGVK